MLRLPTPAARAISHNLPVGLAGLVRDGLLALYLFTEGSGTTLVDYSGNERHGTFPGGGNNPTWGGTGLVFSGSTTQANGQYVSLPFTSAELAAAVTWQACFTQDTINQGPFLSSDTAGNLQIGTPWTYTKSATVRTLWTGFASNQSKTYTYDPTYGVEVVTVVRTSSGGDSLYMGSPATKYVATTSTLGGGNTTGGTVWLGKSDATWNTIKSFTGTFHFLAVYNRALTAEEVAQNSRAVKAWNAATRAIAPVYLNTTTTRTLIAVGDSNTYGFGGATSSFDSMTLAQTTSRVNFGITGIHVGEGNGHGLLYSMAMRNLPLITPAAAWCGLVLMAGTNDLSGSATAAQTFALLQAMIGDFLCACRDKGATGRVLVRPIPNFGPSYADQTKQQAYNALIKSAYVDASVSGVYSYDPADIPLVTATDAYLDSTYFQADQVHLKTAGQAIYATKDATVIDTWS